jgi:hypothetical protein
VIKNANIFLEGNWNKDLPWRGWTRLGYSICIYENHSKSPCITIIY